MSTTSTVITIIICVILVAAIGFALVKGIWSAAKKITVPIQIALFVVMLVCVVRLFCTKENAQKLYEGIERTGISQNVENTMRSALNLSPAEVAKAEPKAAQNDNAVEASKPARPQPEVSASATVPNPAPATSSSPVESTTAKVQPEQITAAVKTGAQEAESPTVVNVEVKVATTPQRVVEREPAPAPADVPDYSKLNKGKKTFSYALPFDAKVTVGFKDNTYRVIVETLGRLDSGEKKEVGKLIMNSLGKYIGKAIDSWDKSKISIESRYEDAEERTRVFAIIPPDAID